MNIELGTLEILIGAAAGFLAAMAFAVRSAVQQLNHSYDLLHGELAQEKKQADDLRTRVLDLESKLSLRENRIGELEITLSSVCEQLRELQQWKVLAQAEIEGKDRKIKDLETANSERERQNQQLFEANKVLSIENRTYKNAITLLGIDLHQQAQEKTAASEQQETKPDSTADTGSTPSAEQKAA
jgi:gas vesicle protein